MVEKNDSKKELKMIRIFEIPRDLINSMKLQKKNKKLLNFLEVQLSVHKRLFWMPLKFTCWTASSTI